MQTALLTGYSGFIGRRLARRLLQMGDVRLLLLGRSAPEGHLSAALHIEADLTRLRGRSWDTSLWPIPDVVFHLAGFVPKSQSDADSFEEIFEANVMGTSSLLQMLPRSPFRFIFSSTLDVYARGEGTLTESSRIDPISFYGSSKWFSERCVRAFCEAAGNRYAVLRYGHIYGPGEDAFRKFIPIAIKRMIQGDPPIVHGDGSAERDFLFVDDAVEATIRAAFEVADTIPQLNIVSGQSQSIREIAEILQRVTGLRSEPLFQPGTTGASVRFDNTLMHKTLGTWPLTALSDGLALEVADFRARRVS